MRGLAQRLALIFGIVFLLVGVLGLFVDNGMTMEADPDRAGRLFGLFPVNLAHNLVHLAFGIWGIVASRSLAASRTYGRAGAVMYALLVVLAFVSPTTFGFIPIGDHDIWLHAVLALGLAYIGFAGREAAPEVAVR